MKCIINFQTGPYKFTRATAGSRLELRGNGEALISDSGLVTDMEIKCLLTSQPPHGPLHRDHSESLRDHRQCGVFLTSGLRREHEEMVRTLKPPNQVRNWGTSLLGAAVVGQRRTTL